ncbi:bifunctional ornithine acetyltransferase/N-acetylglutamate synthase [Bacillus sp. AFS076308]|uniref:bifunctional glutamate N-acetyltransferase/amino-acid acetyltransferase ArgJ n=1 Tax=unclassified Bacillus (in: firmicutes) TaxID=185979 RepID=UPI000BF3B99A|nr:MULTISPECIES: bifunctional glutamate N-acetyltransferase/amino-acid acetyltransferase ArgJ [unclassified Bacillus (in: firmicutes)]PFO08635.1 bifunctional ornithine acetyltransferase/N-acetylglutamate synthase [Bacillus sp. AFS076308]PGV49940.1 bifunctional ornithine acetyltransferase/N-acetylglutamate synthase [Bacillus sp. AFS037270]
MTQATSTNKIVILGNESVTLPKGYKAGGMHCGIKKKRLDLGYIVSEVPAAVAGVYTTNIFQAAPLILTQESIAKENKIQAILVNSGNANACTGEQGLLDAAEMQKKFADELGVQQHLVAVTSTGVIGELLPMDCINTGIKQILQSEYEQEENFKQAILTTDTCIKQIGVQLTIDGKTISIGGAAKGSGMIHPNMATMLGFVTTDANIAQEDLLAALKDVTNHTFNMITVDGDTSTNDMVLVMANGLAGNEQLTKDHPDWDCFVDGLEIVCKELAKKIARDGEGATKLVEIQVSGAFSTDAAKTVGKSIISSNLVKTAIYGTDPNWGRIVTAAGYSGVPIEPNLLEVSIGQYKVFEKGLPCPIVEEEVKNYLEQENVVIYVNLNQGDYSATAWGCDLTYDYVKINASYRT